MKFMDLFKRKSVSAPEEKSANVTPIQEPKNLEEKLKTINTLSDVELFESLLISDLGGFILSNIDPAYRTLEITANVTANATQFVIYACDKYSLKSRLTREQMLEEMHGLAKRSKHYYEVTTPPPPELPFDA